MNSFKTYLTSVLVTLAFPYLLCGQSHSTTAGSTFEKAAALQKDYRFAEAEAAYNKLLDSSSDPTLQAELQERILQCHNGKSLMQYIVRPAAVATADFPVGDFFLHLQDFDTKSWIPVPNPFVNIVETAANPFCTATYFGPEGADTRTVIYSTPDESGRWKIYTSSRLDSTTWSLPQLLSTNIVSGGNEIFPHLSPDGRTLYFASDGMAGMGGYDLFYSTLDPSTGSWSAPENLGFPYSSTGNDIFYSDSRDGLYSIIVSDRELSNGKVRIYVTDFIATPVKTSLEEGEDPVAIAKLKGAPKQEKPAAETPAETPQKDSRMLDYSKMIAEVNALRSEHREKLDKLEESRGLYAKASDWDKEFLGDIIMEVEKEAMQIKKRLDEASANVRKVEMEFLANGIIPVVEEIPEEKPAAAAEKTDSKAAYTFPNHKLRTIPYIVIEQPKPKFDYTLKVRGKNEGQFAEDNNLPDGIVYQIQFAVFNKKASIKDLKGLSPVFVHKQPSGKYVHTAGLFRTYAEGSSKVKTVRNAGFKDAFLVAYKNGKSISVKSARQEEGKPVESSGSSWQLVISGYSDALPSGVITAIRDVSHKDISKTSGDNGTLFLVGPFSQKSQAEELAGLLKGLGVNGITIENVKIK